MPFSVKAGRACEHDDFWHMYATKPLVDEFVNLLQAV